MLKIKKIEDKHEISVKAQAKCTSKSKPIHYMENSNCDSDCYRPFQKPTYYINPHA